MTVDLFTHLYILLYLHILAILINIVAYSLYENCSFWIVVEMQVV